MRKALDAGFTNIGQLTKDADLASIRNDPRFQTLYPFGAELTFQEDVEVLLELRGESAGDRFGWIGRSAGDVDGDGLGDILLSAPFLNNGSPSAGRIYVYSSATGKLLWKADGLPGSTLGLSIERIGDIDGDGVPDQIAGAPGGTTSGTARAYSGKDGSLLREWTGEAPGDKFGAAVSGAGDMDGDGVPDVVIGAPNFDGTGQDSGRVYVYSGKDGELLHVLDGENAGDLLGQAVDAHSDGRTKLLISGAPGAGEHGLVFVHRVEGSTVSEAFRIEGQDGDRQLGLMFVSAIGDVNNDGVVDVYGSDWASNGDGIPGCGRIYIHSGKDGKLLHVLAGSTPGEGFGIGSSEAGDVDGDGHDDMLIGSWQYAKGAQGGGRCTLYSGRSGEVMATYTCTTAMETFGFDTTNLGDLNGDGVPDFLITNADSFVSGIRSGRVVIVAGPAREQ